jgi:hypothetical protein
MYEKGETANRYTGCGREDGAETKRGNKGSSELGGRAKKVDTAKKRLKKRQLFPISEM